MQTQALIARLVIGILAALVAIGALQQVPSARAQDSDRSQREDRDSRDADDGDSRDRADGDEGRRSSWLDRFGGRSRESRQGRNSDDGDGDSENRDSGRDAADRSGRGEGESDRGSSSRPSTSSSSSSPGMNMAEYARKVVAEKDKNGNKMLEGDELKGLGGRAATADLNNDKVITIDELVAHLSPPATGSAPASSSSRASPDRDESDDRREDDRDRDRDRGRFSGRRDRDRDRDSEERRDSESTPATKQRVYLGSTGAKSSGEGENDKDKPARRTWRFTPPGERLPTGLPSWFKSRDRNDDGQISMSEYSRTWSKRTVGEFREIDVNDDGVVTPREAAAAAK